MPRWLARSPIALYRRGFGWLLGGRFMMMEHTGRRSGLPRYVVLEVADQEPGELVVCSGHGAGSDWLRNIRANRAVRVWHGRQRAVPATAEIVAADDARERLTRYRDRHPKAAAVLARTLQITELAGGGPLPADVGERLPVVVLRLRG